MQCVRIIWFTIWFFAISVNNSVASPVDTLSVDNKNELGSKMIQDLNTAESKKDEALVSERDNEVGFLRKEDEKGADAYQHFESFHDKDGDAYGYEKHEAYGKSNKDESLNDEEDKISGSHYNYVQELGDKPKYQKYQGSDDPGKAINYHYSYNSDDDDEEKPTFSSKYSENFKKDDSSEKDDDEEEDSDNETESDEEKSTNFSYKIISDDYEDDGNGDVNAKGNGNGNGYNFGHGDRNTDVKYNTKKSDYTAGDDDADSDEEEDDDDEEDKIVTHKSQKNGEAPKYTKNYSTYTTFSSQEGDDDEKNDDKKNDDKEVPKNAIRYQNTHPKTNYRQVVKESDESQENEENDEKPQKVIHKEDIHHEDVELHQPATPAKPRPTKPVTLVKEHRSGYKVQGTLPKTVQSQVVIHASKPIVHVEEHKSGYKIEEKGGDDEGSDDSGKGHGGTISKHLYEIYVTHDTGKSGGGGGKGGDGKDSADAGDDGSGKSENLVLEPLRKPIVKSDEKDNGAYKVNINYGKNPKISGKKSKGKRKGGLKKKKQIIKPHKYEVEEYTDNKEETKQPKIVGKQSSRQHHRDSDDYSNGQQQFIYASEADSDAIYW